MKKWSRVTLGDICEFKYGKSLPADARDGGDYPVYGSNGPVGMHSIALVEGPGLIIGRKGSFGEVAYSETPFWPIDTTYFTTADSSDADLRWLFYLLGTLGLKRLNRAAAIPGLNREDAYRIPVLLPPPEEQRRIAAILDQADAIRARRRQVLAHLEALVDAFFRSEFPPGQTSMVRAGAVMPSMRNGVSPSSTGARPAFSLTLRSITGGSFDPTQVKAALFDKEPPAEKRIREGDFLICRGSGSRELVGAGCAMREDRPELVFPDTMIASAVDGSLMMSEFLEVAWRQPVVRRQIRRVARTTSGIYKVSQGVIASIDIPAPPGQCSGTVR